MIGDRSAVGVGALVSVRVDPGLLSGAALLCNPFSGVPISAKEPECASSSVPQPGSPFADWIRRVIAAVSLWPDKFWFWLGTAALVAALAVLPSEVPLVASPDPAGNSLSLRNADLTPEERPASGSKLFSQANVRFCRFQQVRLEAIGPLTSRADLAIFQALANEWNARCARYGHPPADKRAIDAEALEGEGSALLGAWRRKIHVGVAVPAGPNLSGVQHAASSDDPASGTSPLPPLITSGIPGR